MICPNCGREIPDGTICPCTLQPAPLSDNPALNVVKAIGSSPLFLAMAICLSLSTLLVIFSSTGLNDSLYNMYYYAYSMGFDLDTISGVMDMMRSTSVASAVFSSVPAILIAVAMWLHFITCRSRVSGNISTAGLTICKVLCYIRMIALCLISLLVLAVCGLSIALIASNSIDLYKFSFYSSADIDELKLTIIIILSLIIAFFMFAMILAITYQASIIRMINRTKTISVTGMADDRVSNYLIGMTYFIAVCSFISGMGALFASPIGGAAAISQGVAYILMAVLLSRFRKQMNHVLFPPVQPIDPTQGYPYQAYVPMPGAQQMPYEHPSNADGFQQPQDQTGDRNQPPQQ
ncbi:hypothetical protein [Acutalibacter caecimuris]|uniref:hypothetical protein n=1 Tax=Acutalibacter caecimuris TaxID=3093657 RepID=UPI002AC98918|nr:hypothetical protein [Acutalibacter sp. M00118]